MKTIKWLLLPCMALSCAFIIFSQPSSGLAVDYQPADFRYKAPLLTEEGQNYTSVRLTSEIIGKANSNLADLLLICGGEAAPYFLNSYASAQSSSVITYQMALANAYLKDGFQYLDYELQHESANDIIATSVNISASGQFVKELTLYGSYDGLHWDFIREDSIYQVEGGQKLSVNLLPGEKYTNYRFQLSGNQEPVNFERVWLEYSLDIVAMDYFIEELSPAMTVVQDGKSTVITLDGLKNLMLAEIEISTESIFKRDIYVAGKYHTLYNLAFGSGHYRSLSMPMDGYRCSSDQLELRIDNGDNAPIQVDGVKVSYLAYDMVFQNTDSPVTLYFGNDNITQPPRYDIASYKEYILAEGYGKAAIDEILELSALPDAAPPRDYTLLFNITIIVVAILLAVVLLTRLQKVR